MKVPAIVAAILLAGSLASAAEPNYFPLAVGNRWEYEASGDRDPVAIEVLKIEQIGGRTWFRVHWLNGKEVLLRLDDSQRLVALNLESKEEDLWVSFAVADGAKYQTQIAYCSPYAMMDRQSAPGEVRIQYSGPCSDGGLLSEEYFPSIGLRERVEVTFTGPVTWKLVSARIDGREQAF